MLVWRAPCTWYHISKCSKFHPCSLQAILHAWNKLFVVLIDLPQLPQATSTPTSLDSLKHHKNTAKLWGCLHLSGVVVEQTLSALNLWKKNPPEDTCEKLERFNKWKPEIHQCEIKKTHWNASHVEIQPHTPLTRPDIGVKLGTNVLKAWWTCVLPAKGAKGSHSISFTDLQNPWKTNHGWKPCFCLFRRL